MLLSLSRPDEMAKTMSGQIPVIPSVDGLEASVKAVKAKGPPPVHAWNPPFCGTLDMKIARDGTWFYQGSPINRFALVKLFSSILKMENGDYFLVTPVEKFAIQVEDAPFVAVDMEVAEQGGVAVLQFTTHVEDQVSVDAEHGIRLSFDAETGEPAPYVHIRGGLEALIDRKSFYRLVDLGEEHEGKFGVWSSGVFFPLMDMDALDGL